MPQVQVKEKTSTKKQEVKQRRKVTKSSTQRSNRVEDKQSNSAQASQKKAREKKMHNKEIGSWGEDIAVDFLKKRGFSILERNWKCFAGEADIIALDDKALHFVEVKTRIGTGKGFPAEAVNAKKRQRYEAISELYLSSYDGCETGITFDIISVTLLPNDRVFVRCYNNVLSSDCR